MAKRRITARQAEVLSFIRRTIAETGESPSIREIGRAIGAKYTRGVSGHLAALEKKGYLTTDPGVPRSIVLTDGWEAA